jgi:pyruvyl transferase EpsO
MLGAAACVVTDRLHGHILSVLLGIPHVVLDNSYGKVRSFYETWTAQSDLVDWADSPAEAVHLATGRAAHSIGYGTPRGGTSWLHHGRG